MVDPKIMCRQHLLGEHVETHMFVGSLNKGKKLTGYVDAGFFEPRKLRERHDELAAEIKRRKWNHKSPLPLIETVPDELKDAEVNAEWSLTQLLSRCPECRNNYENLKTKHEP